MMAAMLYIYFPPPEYDAARISRAVTAPAALRAFSFRFEARLMLVAGAFGLFFSKFTC